MKKPPGKSGGAGPRSPLPRRAAAKPESKRVWRISDRAPLGEWVDPSIPVEAPPDAAAESTNERSGGWLESSMDLLRGTEVRHDIETEPGELFGEFEPPPKKPPEGS